VREQDASRDPISAVKYIEKRPKNRSLEGRPKGAERQGERDGQKMTEADPSQR